MGEFILWVWRALCDVASTLETLVGLDFGSVCDAVDTVGRRRLSDMKVVNGTGWLGETMCDLLARHYDGSSVDEMVYLERIRLMECEEQRGIIRRMSLTLNTTLPEDMLYNWAQVFDGVRGDFRLHFVQQVRFEAYDRGVGPFGAASLLVGSLVQGASARALVKGV